MPPHTRRRRHVRSRVCRAVRPQATKPACSRSAEAYAAQYVRYAYGRSRIGERIPAYVVVKKAENARRADREAAPVVQCAVSGARTRARVRGNAGIGSAAMPARSAARGVRALESEVCAGTRCCGWPERDTETREGASVTQFIFFCRQADDAGLLCS